jgi:hypothetical protein
MGDRKKVSAQGVNMMRSKNGWVGIERNIFNHMSDGTDLALMTWLMLRANFAEGACPVRAGYENVWIKRGQIATSIKEIANDLKWTSGLIRKRLDKLVKSGFCTMDAHNTGTIITICNYRNIGSIDEVIPNISTRGEQTLSKRRANGEQTLSNIRNKVIKGKNLNNVKRGNARASATPVERDVDNFLEVYCTAMEKHYGKAPLKTSKLIDLAGEIIAEVGAARSIALAGHFCASNREYYVKRMHSLDVMLADLAILHMCD